MGWDTESSLFLPCCDAGWHTQCSKPFNENTAYGFDLPMSRKNRITTCRWGRRLASMRRTRGSIPCLSWGALAEQIERDGGLAVITLDRPDVLNAFAEALTKLEKGKYTETPVQTQFGWHVIQLDDVRSTPFPAFDTVKQQMLSRMQEQEVQKFVRELRSKAKIE